MALPKDTPIEKLAKRFRVDPAGLTPAARKLTKGDLMKMYGARSDAQVMRTYNDKGQPPLETGPKVAQAAGLTLTTKDLTSIQRVFGAPKIPPSRMKDIDVGDVTLYACCCPCCCAASVTSPNRAGVA
jgi:hypothetical protein